MNTPEAGDDKTEFADNIYGAYVTPLSDHEKTLNVAHAQELKREERLAALLSIIEVLVFSDQYELDTNVVTTPCVIPPHSKLFKVPEHILSSLGEQLEDLNQPIPRPLNVEVTGLPDAGKTSILSFLARRGHKVYDEYAIAKRDPYFRDIHLIRESEVGAEFIPIIIARMKGYNVHEYLRVILESRLELMNMKEGNRPKIPKHVFAARGGFDILAFDIPYIFSLARISREKYYDDTDELTIKLKELLKTLINKALMNLEETDIIMFFGVDWQTTMARRQLRRKKDSNVKLQGRFTNPESWKKLQANYAFALQHIYPYLRAEFGIGLQVIDARGSKSEVKKTASQFVELLDNTYANLN